MTLALNRMFFPKVENVKFYRLEIYSCSLIGVKIALLTKLTAHSHYLMYNEDLLSAVIPPAFLSFLTLSVVLMFSFSS